MVPYPHPHPHPQARQRDTGWYPDSISKAYPAGLVLAGISLALVLRRSEAIPSAFRQTET